MVIVANMDLQFSRILIIFVMLIMIMLPTISATVYKKVSLDSVLVSGETNSSWSSPSGEFAFGFRQVGVKNYSVTVVFQELKQKTIAWSLNGENYIAGLNWTLCISADGFVLSDPNKAPVWVEKVPGVAFGAMLDNGNFVLVGHDSKVLWQTFDIPSDTLLPGQVLNQDSSLFSSINDTDHSRGAFELKMQKDGNLVLRNLNSTRKWTSNTTNSGAVRAVFTKYGQFYLAAENGTMIKEIFPKPGFSSTQFYQRLTLDLDGVFRHLTFDKKNANKAWFVQTNDTLCI